MFHNRLGSWMKVIATAEKGMGRKKVTVRSEGWWSEDVERFLLLGQRHSKLWEARKTRVGEVTLSQLRKNY